MAFKQYIVFGLLIAGLFSPTRNNQVPDYMSNYEGRITEALLDLEQCVNLTKSNPSREELLAATYRGRLSMKSADFWLRYLEPLAYKKINGPLPIEWEVEVFEKWEKPYKRIGSGLTLAEAYLEEDNWSADSLAWYYKQASKSLNIFIADSLTKSIESYDHFWYANRLNLLNLASIYTTGFECANTARVLPELLVMMKSAQEIYTSYSSTYSNKLLSSEYQDLYSEAIDFVSTTKKYTEFNHFEFIRDYINPLFALNQKHIREYQPVSTSFNDYSLSNKATSIFDRQLYEAVSTSGPYRDVSQSDKERIIDLGEMLFHDPILSGNNKRSCASCHDGTQGFTQNKQLTAFHFDGETQMERNTPSLHHVYSNHLLSADGRQISAMEQIREVINNPKEMACSDRQVVEKVMDVKYYKKELKYLSKYTTSKKIEADNIYATLMYYVSSMSEYNSQFNQAINGGDANQDMIAGFNLFMGKAQCATCHFAPVFNGVKPPYVSSEFEVLGIPEDAKYINLSDDRGRGRIHQVPEMQHAFRTPTIRNIGSTAPYMHNGVFTTLEEVMEFYNNGGGMGHGLQVENQSLASDSFQLNETEIDQIIVFMKALTEESKTPSSKSIQSAKESILGNRTFGGTY